MQLYNIISFMTGESEKGGVTITNHSIDLKAIGERIRQIRRIQGKTQELFADENYISTSYLALLETGRRTASIDVLVRIAESCHTTVDYLLFGTPDSSDSPLSRKFTELCSQYPKETIEKSLKLIEFYLTLEHSG